MGFISLLFLIYDNTNRKEQFQHVQKLYFEPLHFEIVYCPKTLLCVILLY